MAERHTMGRSIYSLFDGPNQCISISEKHAIFDFTIEAMGIGSFAKCNLIVKNDLSISFTFHRGKNYYPVGADADAISIILTDAIKKCKERAAWIFDVEYDPKTDSSFYDF